MTAATSFILPGTRDMLKESPLMQPAMVFSLNVARLPILSSAECQGALQPTTCGANQECSTSMSHAPISHAPRFASLTASAANAGVVADWRLAPWVSLAGARISKLHESFSSNSPPGQQHQQPSVPTNDKPTDSKTQHLAAVHGMPHANTPPRPQAIPMTQRTAHKSRPHDSNRHGATPVVEAGQAQAAGDKARRGPMVDADPFKAGKLLFSGAMSAVVSRTFVAPLERVKMELVLKQNTGGAMSTAAEVMRTEGLAGFWKGNAINVLRTAPFKALNFFSFDMYRSVLVQLLDDEGNVARFTAGALAGMTATIICFPLDVVRTRLMAKGSGPRYGGAWHTMAGIVRNEGIRGLYAGCLPAVVGMAPAGSIFYGVFDLLKHRHLEAQAAAAAGGSIGTERPPPRHLGPLQTLLFGAMAGVASELAVYPLEVIRRRMQLHSMVQAAAQSSLRSSSGSSVATGLAAAAVAAAGSLPVAGPAARVLATCRDIFRTEGFAGFYSGMAPNLLQVLPSSALSYYTYDTCKQLLQVDAL